MAEVQEFSTTVVLTITAKSYGVQPVENRWREVERMLLKMFGPGGYEIVTPPHWEERTVMDTTEQPEMEIE